MFVPLVTLLCALAAAAAAPVPGAAPQLPPPAALAPAGGLLAALRESTCVNGVPAPPRTLVVVPGDASLIAAWAPPPNRPCNLSYIVTATTPNEKPIAAEVFHPYATIYGLHSGKEYAVTVIARSPQGRSAAVAGAGTPGGAVVAVPFGLAKGARVGGGWTCREVADPPSCPAAASRLCRAMACQEVAARGLCAAPFVRRADWAAGAVEQRCAAECGCPAAPSLRQSMAAPAADACCSIATAEYWQDEAGRATAGLDL